MVMQQRENLNPILNGTRADMISFVFFVVKGFKSLTTKSTKFTQRTQRFSFIKVKEKNL